MAGDRLRGHVRAQAEASQYQGGSIGETGKHVRGSISSCAFHSVCMRVRTRSHASEALGMGLRARWALGQF